MRGIAPKERQVESAPSPRTTIALDSDRPRIGQRLAMGHPTRV